MLRSEVKAAAASASFPARDRLQFLDVTDEPPLAALQGTARFEQGEGGIDLGTARPDEERKLALGHGQLDRNAAFVLARLLLARGGEEEAGKPAFDGVQR